MSRSTLSSRHCNRSQPGSSRYLSYRFVPHSRAGYLEARAHHVKFITVALPPLCAVNPVPGANALAVRARRQILGNLKLDFAIPDAGMIDAEDSERLGSNAVDIVRVCDRQAAAFGVGDVGCTSAVSVNVPSPPPRLHWICLGMLHCALTDMKWTIISLDVGIAVTLFGQVRVSVP